MGHRYRYIVLAHAGEAKHTWAISALAVSPDSRWVAVGSYRENVRGVVTVWDLATGKEVAHWHAHEEDIQALAFSANGQYILTLADNSREMLFYNPNHRARDKSGPEGRVLRIWGGTRPCWV